MSRATLVRLGALEVLLDVVRRRDGATVSPAAASAPTATAALASPSMGSLARGRSASFIGANPSVTHVRRLGAAALAALLEDDASKLQVCLCRETLSCCSGSAEPEAVLVAAELPPALLQLRHQAGWVVQNLQA